MTASVWPRRLMTGLYLFLALEFALAPSPNHDAWGESLAAPVHLVITGALALANWPKD